jgi:hypothetical protein
MGHIAASERRRHSRAPAEVVRAHTDAQRHLRRLRDREFDSTTGQRLSFLASTKHP